MHCGVEQVAPHHEGPSYFDHLSRLFDLLSGEHPVIAMVAIRSMTNLFVMILFLV